MRWKSDIKHKKRERKKRMEEELTKP